MSGPARLLILTGDGKGKTSSAMGMALRAVGHGLKVRVIQFVKGDDKTGELKASRHFDNFEITQTGKGFLPPSDSLKFAEHQEAAREGLKLAAEILQSGKYDLVILDEICFAGSKNLLEEQEVIEAINSTASETTVIMTGRGATSGLIELADTVTEMKCIKHGAKEGIKAQPGVEY